jgi:ubiquinone/menaquinone biosynthesis C-methylase UbiE
MSNKAEYDHEAANYDKSRFSDSMGRHLDHMHKRILESLIDSSGKLVLEAGVGTGRFATWLAKKGFMMVGIDISRKMLKKTREKKRILNLNVELVMADVRFLPFREGVFDNCICINVMDHFSDVSAFFGQARKVLKSKGRLIFNFSNLQSLYLPLAMLVNSRSQAMFKSGKIWTRWQTFKEIKTLLLFNGFCIKGLRGCFIASGIPLGNNLFPIAKIVNVALEDSRFNIFSGSIFVSGQ